MKKNLFTVLLLVASAASAQQDEGYNIHISFRPFKNQYVYLGYYFGNQYPIVDSAMLDANSEGTFKGTKKLGGGVYLIGFPDKSRFFELLIDKQQHFSVIADSSSLPAGLQFQHSPDNDMFNAYQQYMTVRGREIDDAKKQLVSAKNHQDSSKWAGIIEAKNKDINHYRENIIKNNPSSLLAVLLTAMREPVIPAASKQPGGKYDSLYAYHYYKNHFWDGVNFYDDRLARTTFFDTKLTKYFQQLVYPDADSVIKEIDWMMGYASISPDMQKFLLLKFVNRYINQQYMWEDKVFVHLFEKYFANQHYPWLNAQGEEIIANRAYSLMANMLGSYAADILLPDTAGNNTPLYSVQAPYTLVCFWDPTCGHCKETLPKIDSIYQAKWKAMGVKIYAVGRETGGTKADWLRFIQQHHLQEWTNVFYSKNEDAERITQNTPSYSQLYDVQTFPTLYLLDGAKRIIAKKLSFEQMDEVLKQKAGN
jgi:thiol-disulfide isomerase/thioredoxin